MKPNITFIILFFILSSIATAQVDRSIRPQAGPPPTVNIGQPKTFELKNGLKVLVVENHKLPFVTANLIIDNPPFSQGDKPSTSSLVSALLGKGSKNITKEKFNEEIDFLGATMFIGVENSQATSLTKYFPRILELLAEGALYPKFTEDEFNIEKSKLIEGLQFNENNVGAIANRVGAALTYGINHPFGEFPTAQNSENINLEDVEKFYTKYFVPEHAYLVIVGDVKTTEIKPLIEKNFNEWNGKFPQVAPLSKITNVPQTEINFIDMPNAVQSEIRVQHTVDFKMNDKDYFAVLIANEILGGSFGSYLNMNLREKHGYTYGASANLQPSRYKSRFIASTSVRNAVTDSAVVQVLKEINRINTETVTPEVLANAKNKVIGNFVLNSENPATVANHALNIHTNNLSPTFYENYLQNINKVSIDDVKRVAKKYYLTNNMRIVIAGKGSEVAPSLENFAISGKVVPVNYYNKIGEKVDKPEINKKIDPSVNVKDILNKYFTSIGGKSKLLNVESVIMEAQAEIQGQKLDLEMINTSSGKSKQTISMAGNIVNKQVFNGVSGFSVIQGQKLPLNDEQILDVKSSSYPFPELHIENPKLLGIEIYNGKEVYAIAYNKLTTVYFDINSGLKVGSVKTISQGGQTFTVINEFHDYQEVEGIMFPFTIAQTMGPQKIEFIISAIKINRELQNKEFEE